MELQRAAAIAMQGGWDCYGVLWVLNRQILQRTVLYGINSRMLERIKRKFT